MLARTDSINIISLYNVKLYVHVQPHSPTARAHKVCRCAVQWALVHLAILHP